MLTFDTVRTLDRHAATLDAEQNLEITRLATTISAVVSAKQAFARHSATWADAERGTYGAGYGDGIDLAADLLRVIEEALHNYATTRVSL